MRPTLSHIAAVHVQPQHPGRRLVAAALFVLFLAWSPLAARGQIIENEAAGAANGVPLLGAGARVSLNRIVVPGVAAVAEVSPNTVSPGSQGQGFVLDVWPEIGPADPAVDTLLVTIPPGYSLLRIDGVEVTASPLTLDCAGRGATSYCAAVAGPEATIVLGSPLTTPSGIRIRLSADTPLTVGRGDFTVAVAAAGGRTPATPGNADGDPTDANSLSVRVVDDVDQVRSTVVVTPAVVLADGLAAGAVTVTLRNNMDQPLAGKTVTLSSARGDADILTQPIAPTNSEGVTTGEVRSTVPGLAPIFAADLTDSVTITQPGAVTFTQGLVLALELVASRREVTTGEIVTYSAILRNATSDSVTTVRVENTGPVGFKYVPGSARLRGAPVADPAGDRTLDFAVGTVPAWVDANLNGRADVGESGVVVLSYQMVAGSGATPGDYRNSAVARDACATCILSNVDEAVVHVGVDEFFSLGTIVGKIFEDRNRDGRQQREEAGMAGTRVVLDDGTSALTDSRGLYHFPAVRAGDRLVKIDLASQAGLAAATTDEARIVSVTPGLLARANFGVVVESDTVRVGRPAVRGLQITAQPSYEPVKVLGTIEGPRVLVNGEPLPLPLSEVNTARAAGSDVVELSGDRLARPITFRLEADSAAAVVGWRLVICDALGDTVRVVRGEGRPADVTWDGVRDDGERIHGGEIYRYRLEVEYAQGMRAASPVRTLGINGRSIPAVRLGQSAFAPGTADLTPEARAALKNLAGLLRRYPEERILIAAHADSTRLAPDVRSMWQQRAAAAATHLAAEELIDENRLLPAAGAVDVQTASPDAGGQQAIACWVSVSGEKPHDIKARVLDQHRSTPELAINERTVPVDPDGRFLTQVEDNESNELSVRLRGTHGDEVERSVPLPRLEILEPAGNVRLPYGTAAGGFRIPEQAALEQTQFRLVAATATDAADGVAATCMLVGRTDPPNAVELGRQSLPVEPDGTFRAQLDLRLGDNFFALLVRNPAGVTRIASLALQVSATDQEGQFVVALDLVPELTVYLPRPDAVVTSSQLPISGRTDPENAVTINGEPVPVGADGRFATSVPLSRGRNLLRVQAIDPAGRVATVEREFEQGPPPLFLLALADGVVGQLSSSGYLDPASDLADDGFYADGRLAYYLRGTVAGKYLVTSALDVSRDNMDRILLDVDAEGNDRLFTNLDPDRLYPVYGDSSTVLYDAQSQGRFYLAVDSEDFKATVGNYPLSLGDTELSTFQRTLYGGRVQYQSVSHTRYGEPRTVAVALAADARQVHVQDVLRGTGGSIYYLSHDDVIEGSEQVTLVVRDADTGLLRARLPRQRDVDYAVKYREGRILFHRPISSVIDEESLVHGEVLSGHPVFVEVNYETRAGFLDNATAGGRVRQSLGDHLQVGGTFVQDQAVAGEYQLQGTDVQVRLGENTRLTGELAASRGFGAETFKSDDGGLSFLETTAYDAQEGQAWKAAAEVDVGEWLWVPNRALLRGYVRRIEEGFTSDLTVQDQGSRQHGVSGTLDLLRAGRFAVRYEREETGDSLAAGRATSDLGSVQWVRQAGRWGLATEFQTRGRSFDSDAGLDRSSYGSAAGWMMLGSRVTGRLERQQTLAGVANDQTRLGVKVRAWRGLGFETQAATGTQGSSLLTGATLAVGGSSIYVSQRIEDRAGGRATTVVGTQAPFGSSGRAYTEYQWEQGPEGDRRVSLTGIQRQWEQGPGVNLYLAGERGNVENPNGSTRRTSLSAGIAYAETPGLKSTTRGEVRVESGAADRLQLFLSERLEKRLNQSFVALGSYRYSRTQDRRLDRAEAYFKELSVGVAYRPLMSDAIDGLARYTRLHDFRPADQNTIAQEVYAMDVFSGEATVDIGSGVAWSGKGAGRITRQGPDDDSLTRTRSFLVINRVDYAFRPPLSVAAEYRVLGEVDFHTQRRGWLNELTWTAAKHFRLGAGYNFTDFSDNEFARDDYSLRGWFFRVQGKY